MDNLFNYSVIGFVFISFSDIRKLDSYQFFSTKNENLSVCGYQLKNCINFLRDCSKKLSVWFYQFVIFISWSLSVN